MLFKPQAAARRASESADEQARKPACHVRRPFSRQQARTSPSLWTACQSRRGGGRFKCTGHEGQSHAGSRERQRGREGEEKAGEGVEKAPQDLKQARSSGAVARGWDARGGKQAEAAKRPEGCPQDVEHHEAAAGP